MTTIAWDGSILQHGAKVKEITKVPYAIGSGQTTALLAMRRMGLSAPSAIGIAIDVDEGSGGATNYVDCRTELPEGVKREVKHYTYTDEDIAEFFK